MTRRERLHVVRVVLMLHLLFLPGSFFPVLEVSPILEASLVSESGSCARWLI